MPANFNPIHPLTPLVSGNILLTANTALDMASGSTYLIATAGSNGARIDTIEVKALGSLVATVLRLFWNNGSATTTAANNSLFREISLPDIVASAVSPSSADVSIQINRSIPAGYRLYGTLGTTVLNGWRVTAIGGDY